MHGGTGQADQRPALRGLNGLRGVRGLAVLAVVAAALPIVVAGIRAAIDGWIPAGDVAYVSIRAADVFSSHPPLVGIHTTASAFGGEMVNHPGPIELYWLAPWIKVFGLGPGTALGTSFLNTVCVVAVAWLAYRRAGHLGVVVAMAAMATLAWSLGSERLLDALPPHATLFPFAVLLMAGWSVADRDIVALPVVAASASFVLQTNLAFSLLAPGLVVVSCLMYGRPLVRRSNLRWLAASGALAALLWIPPLYDQLTSRRGNITGLIHAFTARNGASSVATSDAIRLFSGIVALPPWWLPPSFASPAVDSTGEGLSFPVAAVALVVLFAAIGVGAYRAHRRERSAVSTGLAFTLAVLVLTLLTLDQALAADLVPVPTMYARYLWVVSAFAGMVVALAVVAELRQHRESIVGYRRQGFVALAGLTVLAGALALPRADRGTITVTRWGDQATREVSDAVLPAVDGKGLVYLEMPMLMSAAPEVGGGVMAELKRAGVPFVVSDDFLVTQVGRARRYSPGHADVRLSILNGDSDPPSSGARLVVTTRGLSSAEEAELDRMAPELRSAIDDCPGAPSLEDLTPSDLQDLDCERISTDDLERYVELARMRRSQTLKVWLDDPPAL